MKRILLSGYFIFSVFILSSCIDYIGGWRDNIHLSVKAVTFNATGDSVIIKTKGSSWWISDVSVDTVHYFRFPGVDVLSDKFLIKQGCFVIERRDKKTLFVKVDANPLPVNRIITVGFEAGDYFDAVKITQKPE